MKGAIAEPCARTIKAPSNNIMTMMGASQNFFLAFKKAQSSKRNDMLILYR